MSKASLAVAEAVPRIMLLNDLLQADSVIGSLKAVNKKQVIQDIAILASERSGLSESAVFNALLQRERLGSTGIGAGIAVPHGKLPDINKLYGLFVRLDKPIDFESLDGEPVDLVFLLLAPEGAGADHLKALARVARLLRDQTIVSSLRSTRDPAVMYTLLTRDSASHAA